MRQSVPFIGEELIARASDDKHEGNRRGKAIDEILSTAGKPSSWDDAVATPSVTSNPAKSKASIHKPVPRKSASFRKGIVAANKAHIDWLPINNGHGLRINVSGNIDQQLHTEWLRLLQETADNGVGQFEFNLTQAPVLSLTGLAMLMLFKEQKGSQKQDIKLCHCNRQIWELLLWSGMDKYFVIQGTRAEEGTKR